MPPIIDKEKCISCGTCADICCMDVIHKTETKPPVIEVRYPDECWHCRACALDCPVGAITMRYPLSHMMLHVDVPTAKGEM
ncbi:MAG: 4Fe-4S binding protein [Peptococcaceae bacterium]|nr:4Fe-4S binding protein [Peptococcaceae bacterium]